MITHVFVNLSEFSFGDRQLKIESRILFLLNKLVVVRRDCRQHLTANFWLRLQLS